MVATLNTLKLGNYILVKISLMFVMYNSCAEKRVSAVAISNDGLYVCFADKFGVVWVVGLHELDGNESLVNRKAAPLLAHYCSIITSLVSYSQFFHLLSHVDTLGNLKSGIISPAS